MTPRERFLSPLKNDILKPDLAKQGFYPDFMLWLKRSKRQALVFVESKGIELILGDARYESKLDLLQELKELSLAIPVRGHMISATPSDAIATRRPGETRESLRTRGIFDTRRGCCRYPGNPLRFENPDGRRPGVRLTVI
ncbi:MAG: hypothetical protein AABZ67_02415 [Pseudomonadota bacterium]